MSRTPQLLRLRFRTQPGTRKGFFRNRNGNAPIPSPAIAVRSHKTLTNSARINRLFTAIRKSRQPAASSVKPAVLVVKQRRLDKRTLILPQRSGRKS
jgi:hypothetical protein